MWLTSREITQGFTSDVALRDGSLVIVRPAGEEDRRMLSDFVGGLSPKTLSLRFAHPTSPEAALQEIIPGADDFALIAIRENRVVGHAGYHSRAPGRAEAAIVVADAYQSKGLGTILLGELAEAASTLGILEFESLVVPENQGMIKLLADLGFPTVVGVEPGLIRVTFPTSVSPGVLDAFEKREATAAAAAVRGFFQPKSVAVIGAARERGTIGGELFRNILDSGFKGPVYPVNQKSDVVQSVSAYRSVLDCPGPVDLAILVVPARAVMQAAKECAEKGVRSLVVISAGFAEVGQEGALIQRELADLCAENGMRLIGPNCMGIANTDPEVSLNAQFAPFKPIPGRMGFLSQSGALGIAVIEETNRLGLGLSTFASVGNKADISGNDLIEYWEDDDKTGLILLYLESFGNPRKFARITRRVTRRKPIIAVKSGRSSAGFRATQSHTGALLAASDVTVDALFRQSGVVRVDTIGEMFDAAALLSTQPVPKGGRVAIVTNAGGAGILAADACEDLGLKVPELAPSTQSELRSFLPATAGVKNPVDMIASATPDDYAHAIRAVANDPSVDALFVIFIPPIAIAAGDVAGSILHETASLGGRIPLLTTFMAAQGASGILSDGETRVPSYPFPETAARALSRAVEYGRWLATPEGVARTFPDTRKGEAAAIVAKALADGGGGGRWLSPAETERILSCYGISLVKTVLANTPEEAGEAARQIGQKVALKGVAPGLLHKTEAGAVRLNLLGEDETKKAAEEMLGRLASQHIEATGFLVQPMVPPGDEMLVGVTSDPIFGPVVACGAGGVLVELLKDVSVRVSPLTDKDATEMIASLKTFPLLTGYRGGPRYDVKALEEAVLRVGALVEDIREISELDLNPLIVLPEGQGVCVVDARVRVSETKPPLPLGAKKRADDQR